MRRSVARRVAPTLLFGLGLAAGAGVLLLVLLSVRSLGRVPVEAAGAYGLVIAGLIVVARHHPLHPGSLWRVPPSWGRHGSATFAGIFGLALGPGLLTGLPSPALLAILLWTLTSAAVALGIGGFALGRFVPGLVAGGLSAPGRSPDATLQNFDPVRKSGWLVEAGLLAAFSAAILTQA